MEYTPLSPFMRPMSHAHLRVVEDTEAPSHGKPINKWELLRELSKAQAAFGVTERDLTVLQGLLSFFPDDTLGGSSTPMIVFPSNKAICERLNGMPCSTMRRHLARLVDAGLLVRRDSPNGKRFTRRYGNSRMAFGFDLGALYARADEITQAAEAVRVAESRLKRLRMIVSLMRRDLAALAEYGEGMRPDLGLWEQLRTTAILTARALRRKLSVDELGQFRTGLGELLDHARNVIDGPETEDLVTNAAHTGQHHQNSEKDSIELETVTEAAPETIEAPESPTTTHSELVEEHERHHAPNIPLHMVVTSCPSLKTFYPGEIRHWHQLFDAACHVRPAMGISASAWEEAQRCMGPEQASIVVSAILERFAEIRSPGGYLRALTAKAAAGAFSCGPMVMALFGRRSAA